MTSTEGEEKPFILSDLIFVRYHERMVKIMMMDVRMENGIIMEEQDFFDNLDLLTQLGVY